MQTPLWEPAAVKPGPAGKAAAPVHIDRSNLPVIPAKAGIQKRCPDPELVL
jgi:hypothetical protein